jgi:hypothetical protein
MFSICGSLRDDRLWRYSLTWDGGELSGDDLPIAWVLARADELDGVLVGPVEGPYTSTRCQHLQEPTSALYVITGVFTKGAELSGDIPMRPAIPEGAIG